MEGKTNIRIGQSAEGTTYVIMGGMEGKSYERIMEEQKYES